MQGIIANEEHPKTFKHDFTVGIESFHYHYDETVNNKKLMEDKGLLFGINGAYQLTYKNAFFVRPEARASYGFTEYSNPKGKDRNQPHTPNFLVETRFLTGWQFHPIKQLTLAPYTGIAYRHKQDDSSQLKSKENIGGRKRINKLWYVPFGVRGQYDFSNCWFIQGMAEYDWMLKGEQLSYDTTRYPSPLVFKQKKGYGLKGEMLAGYRFDKVSVSFGPYVHYWNIEKTKVVRCHSQDNAGRVYGGSSYEPKNTTKEIGAKINFTF